MHLLNAIFSKWLIIFCKICNLIKCFSVNFNIIFFEYVSLTKLISLVLLCSVQLSLRDFHSLSAFSKLINCKLTFFYSAYYSFLVIKFAFFWSPFFSTAIDFSIDFSSMLSKSLAKYIYTIDLLMISNSQLNWLNFLVVVTMLLQVLRILICHQKAFLLLTQNYYNSFYKL